MTEDKNQPLNKQSDNISKSVDDLIANLPRCDFSQFAIKKLGPADEKQVWNRRLQQLSKDRQSKLKPYQKKLMLVIANPSFHMVPWPQLKW